MVKKYIIAVDSEVPMFKNESIRMFMFASDKKYDTFEQAEKALENINPLRKDSIYTIITVYVKN